MPWPAKSSIKQPDLDSLGKLSGEELLKLTRGRKDYWVPHVLAERTGLGLADQLDRYYEEVPQAERMSSLNNAHFLNVKVAAISIRLNAKYGKGWRNPEKIHALLRKDPKTSLKNNIGILRLVRETGDEALFVRLADMAMADELSDSELRDVIQYLPLYRHRVFSWLVDKAVSGKCPAQTAERARSQLSSYIKEVYLALDEKEHVAGHVPKGPPEDILSALSNLNDESKRQYAASKLIAWSHGVASGGPLPTRSRSDK
jgi:hypothetical protein